MPYLRQIELIEHPGGVPGLCLRLYARHLAEAGVTFRFYLRHQSDPI